MSSTSMAPRFWPAMGRPSRARSTVPCGPLRSVARRPSAAISRSAITVATRSRRTTRAGTVVAPHDLGPLALQNPRHLYGLLFCTVAQTLHDIAGDPKHLGAEVGGFAVLHTWGQQLHHHPHLHCVLPAG